MPEKKSFSEKLAAILDEDEVLNIRILKPLSNLLSDELKQFQLAWSSASLERRREVANAMVEQAEEDVDLEFSSVFFHLLHDQDEEVRLMGLEGLWEDESLELLRELFSLMENDPSDDVREKAIINLGRFALLSELGKLPPRWLKKIRDSLMSRAKNQNLPTGISRRALEGLGYFSQDAEIRELIARAYRSDNALVKASALVAMGRSVDERWLPEIGQELNSEDPSLCYEAARAAGELGSQDLVKPLIHLTSTRDPEIRLTAIWALGQVGGAEATRVLRTLVKSDSEPTREAAQEALAEITFADDPQNILGSLE